MSERRTIQQEIETALAVYGPSTIPAICRATGYTRQQVRNALKPLMDRGHVRRVDLAKVKEEHGRNPYSLYACAQSSKTVGCDAGARQFSTPMATPSSLVRRMWQKLLRAINTPLSF